MWEDMLLTFFSKKGEFYKPRAFDTCRRGRQAPGSRINVATFRSMNIRLRSAVVILISDILDIQIEKKTTRNIRNIFSNLDKIFESVVT
ncbi:hypothetical protein Bhyg_14563 [Pseudolycoriella hygida]|uniref:Uncharacterized protein n=1 Tax=Pseudolycoriella hygida TaxID=35572 RepID=A0A9Q0MTB5_9DIPT|nr:hypothetical protein Bhyg_14563 [Pseudolycoriella hygida]